MRGVYRLSLNPEAIIYAAGAKAADNLFMRLLRSDMPHPLRHRLWIGGSLLGLFVAVFVISQVIGRLQDPSTRLELGGDFVPAYAAGTLVRQGRSVDIYHIDAMQKVEHETVAAADLEPLPFYGPYLNPPFFAAFYAPLSALPYREAAFAWLLFSLACVAISIALLCRMLPADWRVRGLVPLFILISMPFWQAICHLQNSCLSLLILTAVVAIWRRAKSNRAAIIAGVLASLLAYKPQLAAFVMVGLVATLGWPALVGCAVGLSVLAIATLCFMPGTISGYLHALPPLLQMIQERPQYNWGRQVTPQGFWRLLLQGHSGGGARPITTLLITISVAVALIAFTWVLWRSRANVTRRDQIIIITICGSPVLMPYFMDYDLLLMAIPAAIIAVSWVQEGLPRGIGRYAPAAWSLLFISLYVNPGMSGQTRLNLAAVLTAITAIISSQSVWIPSTRSSQPSTPPESAYTSLASAA